MNLQVLIYICASLIGFSSAKEIPDYIHICKRSDPHLTKCVRESIEFLRPHLKRGIPELGVPAMEPLFLNEIDVFPRTERNSIKTTLRNINVFGAGDFRITKIKFDIEKLVFRFELKLDNLRFEGDYDIDAKVVVPIQGSGNFIANATNCEAKVILKSKIVPQDGYRRLLYTSMDLYILIGDYYVHLENLFDGDKTLSQAANEVLNSNKQEFIKSSTPVIQKKLSEILLDIANKISDGIDFDKMIPL